MEIESRKASHMFISKAIQKQTLFMSECPEMSANGLMAVECLFDLVFISFYTCKLRKIENSVMAMLQ